MASRRLSKSALAAIIARKAPPRLSSFAASRAVFGSAHNSGSSHSSLRSPRRILFGVTGNSVALARSAAAAVAQGLIPHPFHLSSLRCFSSTGASQTNQNEYTETAWEGVVNAVDAACVSKQQIVESEHLMKALLEQRDGLARRVFAKAGVDNTSVLQATDNFISRQPKVTGDTSGRTLGSSLSNILENARKHKKEMGDSFVSVEHLLLAFNSDKRFGQELFKNLLLNEKALKDAIQAVPGSEGVTDQNPEGKYEALEKYGNDLTEMARRGKLDPLMNRKSISLNMAWLLAGAKFPGDKAIDGAASQLNMGITCTPTQASSAFLPLVALFWHINQGIEEIMADYVHHEITRNLILVYLRLFLLIVIKDVFVNVFVI